MRTITFERAEKAQNRTHPARNLEEVLDSTHDDDAHFVCYQFEGEDAWPRLTKDQARGDVLDAISFWGSSIDLDVAEHAPWTPEWEASLIDRMSTAILEPTYFYATRHGARAIFCYDEPIDDPSEQEAVTRGLIKRFHDAGIPEADQACWDWTRIFRCPKTPVVQTEVFKTGGIYPTGIAPRMTTSSVSFQKHQGQAPGDSRPVLQALEASGWITRFRAASRGREYHAFLWGQAPLTDTLNPSRNIRLQQLVGSAAAISVNNPNVREQASPEVIFALFFDPVVNAFASDPRRSGEAELWKAVCNYVPKEIAKRDLEEQALDATTPEALGLKERILQGVKTWHPQAAWEWVSRRLVVISPSRSYAVMQSDGTYTEFVTEDGLVPLIQLTGMGSVIPTDRRSNRGQGVVQRSAREIVREHGVPVSTVVVDPSKPYRHILPDGKTFSTFFWRRRTDLQPTYSAEADHYLETLAGPDKGWLERWIGLALSFEAQAPICAVSILGPADLGKSLLAKGLAQCCSRGSYATGRDFGHYQYELARSPWVVIDEGWNLPKGAPSPDAVFRSSVAGDPITIEEKYRPRMTVRYPYRWLLLANNEEVVRGLFRPDMTPEDIHALGQRLKHLDRRKATGSMEGVDTTGWLEDPNYTLVRHFLWLHEQHGVDHVDRTQRFVLEGSPESVRKLSAVNVDTVRVAQAVQDALAEPGQPHVRGSGVGKIFVSSSYLLGCLRGEIKVPLRPVRQMAEKKILRLDGSPTRGWVFEMGLLQKVLDELDMDLLPLWEPTEKEVTK